MKKRPLKIVRILITALLIPIFLTLAYRFVPPPSTLMLRDILFFTLPNRDWVSLKNISASAVNGAIASEDSAFCTHHGFDFKQLERSVEKSFDRDKPVRATSTISQQTAKNLFLWHGRSWLRKGLEVPLTGILELLLPKKRILEIYLNIAEWGPHIYGIEAASRYYFNTPARNLSAQQAALLIAALPSPKRRNAAKPSLFHLVLAASISRKINQQDTSCLR